MKCLKCGKECFEDKYPEIVFRDGDLCVCEECSIDFEQKGDSFGYRSEYMNIHQRAIFDQMFNMWYNELENGKDFQPEGVSRFDIWCEDNIDTDKQRDLMKKIKLHVDAISDILYCDD